MEIRNTNGHVFVKPPTKYTPQNGVLNVAFLFLSSLGYPKNMTCEKCGKEIKGEVIAENEKIYYHPDCYYEDWMGDN